MNDVPVYLPGLEGIDVKGLSPEDVFATLAKVCEFCSIIKRSRMLQYLELLIANLTGVKIKTLHAVEILYLIAQPVSQYCGYGILTR